MSGLSILGVVFLGPSILAMGVLGYFCIFYDFSWLWFFIALGVAIISILLILSSKQEYKYKVYNEALGGGFGWVWMLSIPANIWFVIDALFLEGAWTQLVYGVLVGGMCKALLRGTVEANNESQ